MNTNVAAEFRVKLAETDKELRAAQRLRYEVFVSELGGGGELVDHNARLERDHLDPFFDHLLLCHQPSNEVVGVYRLMRAEKAAAAGGFYSETEYDLTPYSIQGDVCWNLAAPVFTRISRRYGPCITCAGAGAVCGAPSDRSLVGCGSFHEQILRHWRSLCPCFITAILRAWSIACARWKNHIKTWR